MEDKTHKLWDIIIKFLGFTATAASILIGLSQYNSQEKKAAELEFNRNFWSKQNDLYAEVCGKAGAMAAAVNDTESFKKLKQDFLSMYYGQLVLVEDSTVEKAMVEIKSYIDILDVRDTNMINTFKAKILNLSLACRESSATFKRAKLQ